MHSQINFGPGGGRKVFSRPNLQTGSTSFPGRPRAGPGLSDKPAAPLTIPDAAATLRVSRSSIYRLFDSGELCWVRICSARRVSSAEIERFIADHTEAASWPEPSWRQQSAATMAERRQLPPQIRRVELARRSGGKPVLDSVPKTGGADTRGTEGPQGQTSRRRLEGRPPCRATARPNLKLNTYPSPPELNLSDLPTIDGRAGASRRR